MSVEVLSQAVLAFRSGIPRPDADRIVEALLQAEKSAKQSPQPFSFDQLIGQWRLCFATGTRKLRQGGIQLKKGYYVPKLAKAQISFERDGAEKIGNLAQIGALQLRFTGPARFQPKKNLLAFEFTQIQVSLGSIVLKKGAVRGGEAKEKEFAEMKISKLPFFAFFLITDDLIAARGRGGGLALWVRD
ncbi:MAG: hypothetical protein MUC48_21790 [Leptolyngbya sp. Prado105]|jgi:hypothetical protein|nr:hypothetical protein [Leptolyngbya sp. Prado105]